VANTDDLLQTPTHLGAAKSQGQLQGFADEVLSALFAVKPQLCNQKFELKLNDVRFVSHPTLIPQKEQRSGPMAKQQMLIAIAAFAYYAPSYFHKFFVDVSSTISTRFAHNFPLLKN